MMRRFRAAAGWVLAAAFVNGPAHAEDWPGWRGPRGDGTSRETSVPVRWSGTSNVVWKTAIPGAGHSSPIVWQDRLFLETALQEDRLLVGIDRRDGKLLWQQTVVHSPLEAKHTLNSHASSTPATDGQLVYAAFLDRAEMVVAAYDLKGKPRWLVRPGAFASMHGFCSSPVLFQDLVIVNGDHDGDSYIVALERASGRTRWKTPRAHHTRSYCVPTIFQAAGRTQMVLSGDMSVTSYEPATGRLIWNIDGPTEQFVASVVFSARANLFFVTGGFPDHHILAIRPDGTGNVTGTHIAWRTNRGAAYVPSPIIEGGFFLVVSDSGVAHCFEAATGKLAWQERTGEQHASLVSAEGRVYFLNDAGVMHVVRPGANYDLVARNELGENCFASPAISGGQMFLRGDKSLFCIGQPR